jgi:lipoyl(octanoyl) transferase
VSSQESVWRLIRSGPLSGALNMALDDALLQAVAAGNSPPVLRLYRWQPATLTLGYAQPVDAGVNLDACRAAGVAVVRRPTGGRAVLHDREVTYALIAPVGAPFGNSVATSYRVVAGLLRSALRACGLAAELVPGQPRGRQGRAVCFTAPAQHELVIAGCKVAGCAQKRRGRAFLQHGSIPLELDLELLGRLMPLTAGETPADRFATIGWLQRFAAQPLTVDAIEAAVIAAFAAGLGVRFQDDVPSGAETQLADDLCAACYGNESWTLAGPGTRAPARPVGD